MDMLISGISLVYVPVPLSHRTSPNKHKFKEKIIKNFKTVRAEHEAKQGTPLSMGSCQLHMSLTQEASPALLTLLGLGRLRA